jgi:hypothetical protein
VAEDADAIRREIAETREDIAETVDALAYKADVRSRARAKAAELRETLADRTDAIGHLTVPARSPFAQAKRLADDSPLLLALGAVAAGFLIGVVAPKGRAGGSRAARRPT